MWLVWIARRAGSGGAGLALLVVSTDSGRAAAGVVNCSGMGLWWGPHYHSGLSSHFWGKSKKTKSFFPDISSGKKELQKSPCFVPF